MCDTAGTGSWCHEESLYLKSTAAAARWQQGGTSFMTPRGRRQSSEKRCIPRAPKVQRAKMWWDECGGRRPIGPNWSLLRRHCYCRELSQSRPTEPVPSRLGPRGQLDLFGTRPSETVMAQQQQVALQQTHQRLVMFLHSQLPSAFEDMQSESSHSHEPEPSHGHEKHLGRVRRWAPPSPPRPPRARPTAAKLLFAPPREIINVRLACWM